MAIASDSVTFPTVRLFISIAVFFCKFIFTTETFVAATACAFSITLALNADAEVRIANVSGAFTASAEACYLALHIACTHLALRGFLAYSLSASPAYFALIFRARFSIVLSERTIAVMASSARAFIIIEAELALTEVPFVVVPVAAAVTTLELSWSILIDKAIVLALILR